MSAGDEREDVLEHYHGALDEFSRGDPKPVKAMYSHRDEVTLANPFGPAVRGRDQVAARLDYASSRFRDGQVTGHERVAGAAPGMTIAASSQRRPSANSPRCLQKRQSATTKRRVRTVSS